MTKVFRGQCWKIYDRHNLPAFPSFRSKLSPLYYPVFFNPRNRLSLKIWPYPQRKCSVFSRKSINKNAYIRDNATPYFSNLLWDFLLCICGGIDAKNVIVHMVTINQELRHEQMLSSLIWLIRKFSREFIFARLLLSILYACTCMWDISAKYHAIFYCFSEGTIFANAKDPRSCLAYKTGFTKRRYANPTTPR